MNGIFSYQNQKQNICFTLTLYYLVEWCAKYAYLKTMKSCKCTLYQFCQNYKSLRKHLYLFFITFLMRDKCIPFIWTTLSLLKNKCSVVLFTYLLRISCREQVYISFFFYLLKLTLLQRILFQKLLLKFCKRFIRHACV